ncbi:MAG: hypothetical protein K2H22_06295 [Muribaculaceae bacterium]|nr:hypothetical protein [Muribaculaceae bacterium]
MKKIIMILMALCLIAPAAIAQTTLPALTPKQEKNCNKNAKDRAKKLKKEGYDNMGSLPLQDALYKHYAKLELGAMEQQGNGRSKSKNLLRQMALNQAMTEYASKESSMLKGRTFYDAQGNEIDTDSNEEFARFYAAFERLTQASIKGDLQESFTVIRQNPDGAYECTMYMTIDPARAKINREKSLQNAINESKLSQDYARQMSDFINEGFPTLPSDN